MPHAIARGAQVFHSVPHVHHVLFALCLALFLPAVFFGCTGSPDGDDDIVSPSPGEETPPNAEDSPIPGDDDASATEPPGDDDSTSTLPPGDDDSTPTLPPRDDDTGATEPPGDDDSTPTLPPGDDDTGATEPPGDDDSTSTLPPGDDDTGATEVCDTRDNDCDSSVDEGFDQDGDGYKDDVACADAGGTDCDDENSSIRPNATEVCNGIDDDCDGLVDDLDDLVFYQDSDEDGYGDPAVSTTDCARPDGFVANADDCDDGNSGPGPDFRDVDPGHDDVRAHPAGWADWPDVGRVHPLCFRQA